MPTNDRLKFRSGNDSIEGPKVLVFILALVKILTPIIIAILVFVERKELMHIGSEMAKGFGGVFRASG